VDNSDDQGGEILHGLRELHDVEVVLVVDGADGGGGRNAGGDKHKNSERDDLWGERVREVAIQAFKRIRFIQLCVKNVPVFAF
jgi:hypothetical protein